jgi:REP element-mobilizing transposase RayT
MSKTVGSIIRGFKIGVGRWMRENTGLRDTWQRNYLEHIIRNDVALNRIRQYIFDNPLRWACDRYNPQAVNPETEDPWRE